MKIGVSGAAIVQAQRSSVRVGRPHRMMSAGTSTATTTTAATRVAGSTASSRAGSSIRASILCASTAAVQHDRGADDGGPAARYVMRMSIPISTSGQMRIAMIADATPSIVPTCEK